MSWPTIALLELRGVGFVWVLPSEAAHAIDAINVTGLDLDLPITGGEPRYGGIIDADLDLLLSSGQIQARTAQIQIGGTFSVGIRGLGWVWVLREKITDRTLELRTADMVIAGRMSEITIDDGWLAAVVVEDPTADRGLLLEPGAVVGPATWPRSDDQRADDGEAAFVGTPAVAPQSEGAPYPVIIGGPGRGVPLRGLGVIATTDLPAGPALLVETSDAPTSTTDHQLIVSAGKIDAATVRRIGTDQNSAPTAEDCTVTIGHDKLGRIVSLISPGSALDVPGEDSESWAALVDGYGIADPFGSGPLRRADHVLRWALERSTLRVDHRSWPRLSALAAFKIDVAIFSQVGAWAWVQSQLLPALPIEMAAGPGGLFFWPDLPVSGADTAICTLTARQSCHRLGPVVAVELDPVSHLACSFAFDARTGRGARTLRVEPRWPGIARAAGVLPSVWAADAFNTHGRTDATLDLPITSDLQTAEKLALIHVERRSRPRFEVSVAVERAAWQSLAWRAPLLGDPVRFVDTTMGVDALATVVRVGYAGSTYTLGLRWWLHYGREF